jgi:hypothetical protein
MRYLLIFLLLCLPCWAVQTEKYVDFTLGTDDAGHGGAVGTDAWKTLSYAESQVGDITGTAGGLRIRCSNGTDTTLVVVLGPTTDADSPLTIEGDSTYKLIVSNAPALDIREEYVNVYGFWAETAAINADSQAPIRVSTLDAGNLIQIKNCTFKGANDADTLQQGIYIDDADAIVRIWNTLVYNVSQYDSALNQAVRIVCSSGLMYNCTVVGGKYGVVASAGTIVCKNVVVLGSLTADFIDGGAGATSTQIHCASEDATGNDFDTNADGNIVSQTLTAFSATYRLTVGNPCIDAGVDLSGDTPAITDDIDGKARGATYDIGCSEYVAASGMNLFRRRAIQW